MKPLRSVFAPVVIATLLSSACAAKTAPAVYPSATAPAEAPNRISENLNRYLEKGDFNNAMIMAAMLGDAKIVRSMLDKGADPDFVDVTGNTALSWAALLGSADAITALLEKNADIRKTPGIMDFAAYKGDVECLYLLVRAGANVNAIFDRSMPLHTAAYMGHWKAVEFLLQAGADPNVKVPLSAFLDPDDVKDIPLLKEKTEVSGFEIAQGMLQWLQKSKKFEKIYTPEQMEKKRKRFEQTIAILSSFHLVSPAMSLNRS